MANLLKLLLLAAFFNALAWIILIPIWQYPDEQAHFAQVQDLAEIGQVPDGLDTSYEIALSEKILGTERDGFGNNQYTYHPEYKTDYVDSLFGKEESQISQLPKSSRTNFVKIESTHNPPLYYLIGALFYKTANHADLFTRVYVTRVASIILFILTVFLSYFIALAVFAKNKILPITFTSLVAFKPMFVFSSTGVLPDPITNFLFTLVIFICIKILKGISLPYLLTLLLIFILGVLTRQQFLIALIFVIIAFMFKIFQNLAQAQKFIFSKISLLILLALFFLKDHIYRFLTTSPFRIPESSNIQLSKILDFQFINFLAEFTKQTIAQTLPWYWGVYKWLSLTVPHINYQIINRVIILAIVGLIAKLFLEIIRKKIDKTTLIIFFLITISAVYFLIFAIWDYFFFLSHGFQFGLQGRYFFPTLIAHFLLMLTGLWFLLKVPLQKVAKWGLFLISFAMIIFNDLSLAYVSASYYDFSSLTSFVNHVSHYKPLILKGNVILGLIFAALLTQAIFLFSLGQYILKIKFVSINESS